MIVDWEREREKLGKISEYWHLGIFRFITIYKYMIVYKYTYIYNLIIYLYLYFTKSTHMFV